MAVPKLRFRAEDGSEFPEWEEKRLGNYLKENRNRNTDNKYSKTDVLSVSGDYGVVNQIEFQGRSFAGKNVSQYHILPYQGIVYTKSPLKASPYGIIKSNQGNEGIVSTLYAVFDCRSNCNSRFVDYYFSLNERLNRYLKPLVNIGAKHDMKINNDRFLSGLVYFPSLPEQQKIADFLSTIDSIISSQKKELAAWEQRKKGVMQKLFSQEVRFKADDGSDFPEWEEKRLGEISNRVTRKNLNCETNVPLTISGSYGLIDQRLFFNKIVAAEDLSKYYLLKKGEFAYNRSSSIGYDYGAIKRLTNYEQGAVSTLYLCFSTNNNVNDNFLLWYFESGKWHKYAQTVCAEGARNHGLLNISANDFFDLPVIFPALPEQQKIADCLSSIDEVIQKEKEELEKWQELKKGLLQQMFV